MITFGWSARVQARKRRSSAATSWPSQRATCQPNARSLASRSPRSLTSRTQVSDWILLWSTIATISPSRALAAGRATPRTALPAARRRRSARRRGARVPASRLASAMPFAFEMPMPSEPVFAWMYGVSTCGWPGRPCRRRSWCSESSSEQPEADQHVVERRRVVPFDEKKMSHGLAPLVEIAHLVQEQPAHDLERAEAGADVPGPRARDHVERVDARQRGKRRARRSTGVDVAAAAAGTRSTGTYCSSSDSPWSVCSHPCLCSDSSCLTRVFWDVGQQATAVTGPSAISRSATIQSCGR